MNVPVRSTRRYCINTYSTSTTPGVVANLTCRIICTSNTVRVLEVSTVRVRDLSFVARKKIIAHTVLMDMRLEDSVGEVNLKI